MRERERERERERAAPPTSSSDFLARSWDPAPPRSRGQCIKIAHSRPINVPSTSRPIPEPQDLRGSPSPSKQGATPSPSLRQPSPALVLPMLRPHFDPNVSHGWQAPPVLSPPPPDQSALGARRTFGQHALRCAPPPPPADCLTHSSPNVSALWPPCRPAAVPPFLPHDHPPHLLVLCLCISARYPSMPA